MRDDEWQTWADDSAEHRDPRDPDVAHLLARCVHDGELDKLVDAHRNLGSLWEPGLLDTRRGRAIVSGDTSPCP